MIFARAKVQSSGQVLRSQMVGSEEFCGSCEFSEIVVETVPGTFCRLLGMVKTSTSTRTENWGVHTSIFPEPSDKQ
jgi:hypothetical protein